MYFLVLLAKGGVFLFLQILIAIVLILVAMRYNDKIKIERSKDIKIYSSEDEQKARLRRNIAGVLAAMFAFSVLFSLSLDTPTKKSNSTKEVTTSTSDVNKQEAEQEKKRQDEEQQKAKLAEQKAASDEIQSILNNTPSVKDDVEQAVTYQSWGTGKYQARNAFHWKVSVKDRTITHVRCQIINFTTGTEWTFWRRMTFSDGAGNKWSKDLETFAGQTGDGKNTQIVRGGKYETWQGALSEVKYGYEILANASNPILRLSGEKYYEDIKPNEGDVQRIKAALRLEELIGKLNYGKLVN